MSEDLLNIRQASPLLNVSETSLRRWTNAGLLASLRVGGRRERRFRRADLEAFMEHQPASADGGPEGGDGNGGSGPSGAGHDGHVIVGTTPVHLGAHLCGFYGSDAGRLRLAANFLADGVTSHGACFLVAQPQTRTAVVDRLRERVSTLDKQVAAGRLVLDKGAETPAGQLKFWEKHMAQAMKGGARSLRVVTDISSSFGRISKQMLADYEGAYENQIARRFPVISLCAYDARHSSGLSMLAALKAHPDQARYFAYHVYA